jgi:Lectin C-type domain
MKESLSALPFAVCLCLVRCAVADDVEPAILPSVESQYSAEAAKAEAEVARAETEAAKARKAAAATRLKAYKERLAEVTKAGDFDKAQAIKARIEQLEKEPESKPAKTAKRPRPKDTVRFGGHTYALIKDPASWHVAKQRCEEMGGHLIVIDSSAEGAFFESLCTTTDWTWAGASDEETEGKWVWVTGKQLARTDWIAMDGSEEQHYLGFNRLSKKWHDCNEEHRVHFVCEWDH